MNVFSSPRRRVALCVLFGALCAVPASARETGEPQRFHVVYPGQRLSSIARRYKVSVEAIRTANGLAKNARLKPGDKLTIPGLDDPDGTRARTLYPPQHPADTVPASTRKDKDDVARDELDDAPRRHTVYTGQRLESIAKRYHVSLDALCTANGLTRRSKLRAGQVLSIPRPGESGSSVAQDPAFAKRGAGLTLRKGYLDLFTYSSRYHGYALDKKGRVTTAAQAEVSKLFGAADPHPATDPKLIQLLTRVSEHFGNKPLRIVSGYRTRSFFEDSRHKSSHAVDFSIPGIDNVVLRDYLRTLSSVGVGYYPNSSFVHLDVRDSTTYWVDYAGPGEAPRHSKQQNRDQEAEGDLQDPEVTEGDRPSSSPTPALEAPPAPLGVGAIPAVEDEPKRAPEPARDVQNTPK